MWPMWSHLLKKSLMENFIFCAVSVPFILCSIFVTSPHWLLISSLIASSVYLMKNLLPDLTPRNFWKFKCSQWVKRSQPGYWDRVPLYCNFCLIFRTTRPLLSAAWDRVFHIITRFTEILHPFPCPLGIIVSFFKSSGITVSTFSRLWTSLSSFRKSYHWSLMYTAWRGFFQLQFPYNKYCKCKIYHQKILPRSWWRLKRFLPRSQRPTKFSGHESCESENTNFSKCHLI